VYLDKSFKTQLPGLQVVEKQFSDIQVNGTPMLAPKINLKKGVWFQMMSDICHITRGAHIELFQNKFQVCHN
jgi:hypothetical protein